MSEFAEARWTALGTTVAVLVDDATALTRARAAVDWELVSIDAACSRFRDDSELMRVNGAAGRWVEVSPLLVEALDVALRAAELTEGTVDPTIGWALVLSGYERDFASHPPRALPALTAQRVPGWRTIELDRQRGKVRIPSAVRLDLGATAKALAADRAVAAATERAGGCGVLVNLGGDIATGGTAPPDGWMIRVTDDHRAGPGAPGQLVSVPAGGLATSSTTVRSWERGGHHIIDPETSRPSASRWRTVSVAAETCVDANIASTAAIVRDGDAPQWLAELGLPARLVDRDGAVTTVGGWPEEAAAA